MIKIKENKGVTLIALIVTIIILLILSGISISALTGDNSIIKQAGEAKKESGIANEREALEVAIIKAREKDKKGKISYDTLNPELKGYDVDVKGMGKRVVVTFNTSGKKYRVDQNGNIIEDNRKTFDNPTSVYAKLYTDHTLILSSFDYTDPNREVQTDYSCTRAWRSNEFTKVIIYDEIAPSSGFQMFADCGALEKIEKIENLHTEFMTSMARMFLKCGSFVDLDLSYFDTRNVTNMGSMFWFCSKLETVDLSSFNTENLTNMLEMFEGCIAIKEIDLSSFNTKNVKDMAEVFYKCNSLEKINFGNNFDTSSATTMGAMFSNCFKLKEIDTSNFNTSNVTKMTSMFEGCGKSIDGELKLDLTSFDTSKVTDMTLMFSGCSTIHTLDLSSFHTDALTSMTRMFLGCYALETLDLSNAEFKSVTSMYQIFGADSKLNSINFKNADFSSVTSYDLFFQKRNGYTTVPITITVSSDETEATAQKEFLSARRQTAGVSQPTYITE